MTEDYDIRQQNLMIDKIKQFQNEEIHLATLVRDLEALLNALESVPNDWKLAFHEEWWNLEQAYAVALDRNDDSVLIENEELISSSLDNMRKLISINKIQ